MKTHLPQTSNALKTKPDRLKVKPDKPEKPRKTTQPPMLDNTHKQHPPAQAKLFDLG